MGGVVNQVLSNYVLSLSGSKEKNAKILNVAEVLL